MARKQTTEGLEWLIHSVMSFNGSGYADMDDAESYIDSYIAYKRMKNKPKEAALMQIYRMEMRAIVEDLLAKTNGAGRTPSDKSLKHFETFKKQVYLSL